MNIGLHSISGYCAALLVMCMQNWKAAVRM